MSDRQLKVAFGRKLGVIENATRTWAELVPVFAEPKQDKMTMAEYLAMSVRDQSFAKNKGYFVGGQFASERRRKDQMTVRSVVTLDIDDNAEAIWDAVTLTGGVPGLEGMTYHVHTTRKHTPEKPRLRVVIPLARDISRAEYMLVVRYLSHQVDPRMLAVAAESFSPIQLMYLPSICSDGEFYQEAVEGEFFDPDIALESFDIEKPETWPKRPDELKATGDSDRKMQHPESKKATVPIITAVHRAWSPEEFIERFLSDHYEEAGEGRYLPSGASGAPSVRIYDDAYIHSDHSHSDPAHGQHNCFDAGRLILFGFLDTGYEDVSLTESPSFKEMDAFMREQAEIPPIMKAIEEELESERTAMLLGMLDLDDNDCDLEDDDEDDNEDLIGAPTKAPKKQKPQNIDDLIDSLRNKILEVKSLSEVTTLCNKVSGISVELFPVSYRTTLVDMLQKRMGEMGHKLSKGDVRQMLRPSIPNLRDKQKGQDLPGWVEDWVYVSKDNAFYNLATNETLGKDGFNGRYMVDAATTVGVNDRGLPLVSASEAALAIYDVKTPYAFQFDPDKPEMFEDGHSTYVNSYRAPELPRDGYSGDEGVSLLMRLLKDMFPDPEHQTLALDFIVHCCTRPGKKIRYAMLVKGAEGEGKSLLYLLMSKLLGENNSTTIGSRQLKKEFNGWASEKLLCVIEEVKIPGKEAREILNDLKPVITNDLIPIEKKAVDAAQERNFCNMYMTTNYEDCLPMESDNSRYLVLFTRFRNNTEVRDWKAANIEKEGFHYPVKLAEHIKKRPWQFVRAFEKHEFSPTFNPDERAPHTCFKDQMAEDSKSEERRIFDMLVEEGQHIDITPEIVVWQSLKDQFDVRDVGRTLRGPGIGAFMKGLGYVKVETTMPVSGRTKKVRVWVSCLDWLGERGMLNDKGKEAVRELYEQLNEAEDLLT